MANTKKTETTEEPIEKEAVEEVTASVIDTSHVEKENTELKATVEALKAQMEMMAQMIGAQKQEPVSPKKERNITFVNLTDGTVVLKGSNIWVIEGQFNTRTFMEREARLIVSNCGNLIRSGAVYIDDAEFVEDNDLGEVYRYMVNGDELKNLFAKPANEVIEIYNTVPDMQKKIIVGMIVSKRLRGENVDGNVLLQLGALSGKDLVNIEPDE